MLKILLCHSLDITNPLVLLRQLEMLSLRSSAHEDTLGRVARGGAIQPQCCGCEWQDPQGPGHTPSSLLSTRTSA
jgi:hypothetical protein